MKDVELGTFIKILGKNSYELVLPVALLTHSQQYQSPSGTLSNSGLKQYIWNALSQLSHSSSASSSCSPWQNWQRAFIMLLSQAMLLSSCW